MAARLTGRGDLDLSGDATTPGASGDGKPSIIYDFTTGEVLIDTDGETASKGRGGNRVPRVEAPRLGAAGHADGYTLARLEPVSRCGTIHNEAVTPLEGMDGGHRLADLAHGRK